jgi:hypothetical protein
MFEGGLGFVPPLQKATPTSVGSKCQSKVLVSISLDGYSSNNVLCESESHSVGMFAKPSCLQIFFELQ